MSSGSAARNIAWGQVAGDRFLLVVVMPVYNEAGCIERVLGEWLAALENIDASLLIVNDGSTDGTERILENLNDREPRLRVINQPNGGHGAAILRGYRRAIALTPNIFSDR